MSRWRSWPRTRTLGRQDFQLPHPTRIFVSPQPFHPLCCSCVPGWIANRELVFGRADTQGFCLLALQVLQMSVWPQGSIKATGRQVLDQLSLSSGSRCLRDVVHGPEDRDECVVLHADRDFGSVSAIPWETFSLTTQPSFLSRSHSLTAPHPHQQQCKWHLRPSGCMQPCHSPLPHRAKTGFR